MSRPLDHTTMGRGEITAMSDGTGTGVLLEDLDDDGHVDVVLPNLSGETSVLWNRGDATFDRQPLIEGRFRQALSADVDADGRRDLLLTTGIGPPITMRSTGGRSYERTEFRTSAVAYSIATGALDGDDRLQIVTGSYNAELTQNRDPRALNGNGTGAALHTIDGNTVETEFLIESAQALATLVVDLDGDGRQDVFMGNDLGTPDRIWLATDDGLTLTEPFDTTTLSTMSLDVVDLDNDGDDDVIATDMAPMPGSDLDPWLEVMPDIEAARVDDVQDPRNKLQFVSDGVYTDRAAEFGFDATGWSWSGVAGDLDNDGLPDLYVVNGMQATSIFTELPDGILVEANQAFRNTGTGLEAMPGWDLADTAGGRGMAQGDLDGDGDLDIVVNNLGSPAMLFENRLCGGAAVIVDPVWEGAPNRDAVSTVVTVTSGDITARRQILSARGYLSAPPSEAHVGLGDATEPVTVDVVWPDGATSQITDVSPGTRLTVIRTDGPIVRDGGEG